MNQKSERYIFSTEGHIYKVTKTMRDNVHLSEINHSNTDIPIKLVHNNHTRLDQVIYRRAILYVDRLYIDGLHIRLLFIERLVLCSFLLIFYYLVLWVVNKRIPATNNKGGTRTNRSFY